jgi:hypothetical protein
MKVSMSMEGAADRPRSEALLTTCERNAERQGKLLDEALLATYPASDPLSAFVVN